MTDDTQQIPGGLLVAFEGVDGAGKTTQANRLRDRLQSVGLEVTFTKEPTDGEWGQLIRQSAQDGRLEPDEELEAFLKDRREHVDEVIEPALENGEAVIVDRYYLSTVAYQGVHGFDPEEILDRNEKFAPRPDMFVFLDIEPDVGLDRIHERGDSSDLFERLDNLREAAKIFRQFDDRDYVFKLDGTRDVDDIHDEVAEALYFGPLFEKLCVKTNYLDECEPAYCAFRDKCGYPEMGPLAPVELDDGIESIKAALLERLSD